MVLTKADLQEILEYAPSTGKFIRKRYSSPNAKKGDEAGTLGKDGYLIISIRRKRYPAHRLAFLYMTGRFPVDQVDHVNHKRFDNRWENLREVTRKENAKNISMAKNNTSGFTGVHWRADAEKWRSHICYSGKVKYLGYFRALSDAVKARIDAEAKYGFHENHGV